MRRFPQAPGTSEPGAYGVLADGDILWYGCGNELCRMDGDRTTVFGRDSGLPDRVLLGIQKDRQGSLWVRAKNAGVFVLPAGQTRFRKPGAPVPGNSTGRVATDAEGRILIPSPDGRANECVPFSIRLDALRPTDCVESDWELLETVARQLVEPEVPSN